MTAPVVGHFINNAVSVTFMFIGSDDGYSSTRHEALTPEMASSVAFWGILALAGGITALRLFRGLESRRPEVVPGKTYVTDFIPVMVTVFLFVVICAGQLMLIMG